MSPIAPTSARLAHASKGVVYAFTNKGETIVGAASSTVASAFERVGIETSKGRWKVSVGNLRLATNEEAAAYHAALNASRAALPVFAKGDVVEFTHKGAVERGVVTSAKLLKGDRVSVDQPDKFRSWKIPAVELKVVRVEPGAAGLLVGYSVEGYKEAKFMSEETVCFEARICFDGRTIGVAKNEGHGGSTHTQVNFTRNMSDEVLTEARQRLATFESLLKQAALAAGLDHQHYELDDAFIRWYRSERALGVSLHDTFVRTAAEFAAFDAKYKITKPVEASPTPAV